MSAAKEDASGVCVDVAVPLPLPTTLTYRLPTELATLATVGARAHVRVGPRRYTGVIVTVGSRPPAGIAPRAVESLIDLEPALSERLLELARFAADYYLAPIGEVLQAMLPSGLRALGGGRVRLNDAGALAPPADEDERAVVEALLASGDRPLADLAAELGPEIDVGGVVRRLQQRGRLRLEREAAQTRYLNAVELASGELSELFERCGRSAKGRAVVELLAALERPATVQELVEAVGCGPTVVRRLGRLGVVRQFSQPERRGFERHLLASSHRTAVHELRADQEAAVEQLEAAVGRREYRAFLLAGITGSGKTEVYARALDRAVEEGRGAIVLVPEIAMVPDLARTLVERYGARVAVLHSSMSPGERNEQWRRLRSGEALVAVGPRSAVFAPVGDLAVVVVDEEHDPSYKQDTTPRYSGRDLALVRARSAAAVAVLVSATPSLETRLNAQRRRYVGLELTERVGFGALPEGILVDLRKEDFRHRPGEVHFSSRLRAEIEQTVAAGEQAILLRNRRGYAPLLLCRACGEDMRCDDCGLPRTWHRRRGVLLCHYCGSTKAVPKVCARCGEGALEAIGAGTERVEDTFSEIFPAVTVDVLDRDAAQRPGGAAAVLERFRSGRTQVLVGTQMVSKGHHFPRVSLAAVLSADSYLGFPDFRAVERTYNLLTQLAGRAGRGDSAGRVVIQTHYPQHYGVRAALEHDDAVFAEEEMRFRRTFHYPPFTRVVLLLLRDRDRERGERRIGEIAQRLGEHPLAAGVRVTGPAPAPLERLRGRWRFQLLLRGPSGSQLRRLLRASSVLETSADLVVDVDPQDLL